MASKEQYAQWITANQDKAGTPEFATVAQAFRQAKVSEGMAASSDNYSADPIEGKSMAYRLAAGAGKGMTDVVRGIGQAAGLVDQESIDAAKQRDAALMETGAGQVGNAIGSTAALAPAALIPGANTMAGAALLGGASGALEPVATGESRLANTALGAGGGFVGGAAAKGLSRVLSPQTDQAVVDLMNEGVTPTPGQILGGYSKTLESAAESIPFVGQGIRGAKERANTEFNQAAINRALSNILKSTTAVGHEGIKEADDLVGKAYKDALSLVPIVQFDNQFTSALSNIRQMANQLTPERAAQLNRIIDDRLVSKITPANTLSGEGLNSIQSELKALARDRVATSDPDYREQGRALMAVAQELRDLAGRQNPFAKDLLNKADTAYAMLVRVSDAGSKSATGEFTPAQLGTAIRTADRSVRKRAIAKGEGLMQDLSSAGRQVLGGNLPNSGTADRALASTALLGGAAYIDPALLAGTLAARGIYTEPMQKALAAALVRRPSSSRAAGDLVRRLSPAAAIAGSQATNR